MSAGAFITNAIYEADNDEFYRIRVQPETLALTIASTANASGAGPLVGGRPSAVVSKGRQSFGMNARLIRIRFTNTIPPGYLQNGIITLPVLTQASFLAYALGAVGTYSLNGTDYDVEVVGRTPENAR